MALSINSNRAATKIQHSLGKNLMQVHNRMERLSSGLRVNRASDDAAGLVVSERMRGEISGLNQNVRNAEQATNLLQVAEGSLQEIGDILQRMRELGMQASSGTLSDTNREALNAEFYQLGLEIDRITYATTYNDQSLLSGYGNNVSVTASTAISASDTTGVVRVGLSVSESGTYTFADTVADNALTLGNGTVTQTVDIGSLLEDNAVSAGTSVIADFDRLGVQVTLAGSNLAGASGDYVDGELDGQTIVVEQSTGGSFQVGPSESIDDRIEVGFSDLRTTGSQLNLGSISIETIGNARESLASIDQAISNVSKERGKIGAVQNRLDSTITNTENEIENIQASESTIRDADIATEVTEFSRGQILVQSSNAMLVQANVSSVVTLALF